MLLGEHRPQAASEIFTPQTVAVTVWSEGYGGLLIPPVPLTIIWQPQRRSDSSSARRKQLRPSAWLKKSCLRSDMFVFTEWAPVCPGFLLQACAHRWKNIYYNSEHILPHGYCSVIPATLHDRTKPLIPCYEGTEEARWLFETFVLLSNITDGTSWRLGAGTGKVFLAWIRASMQFDFGVHKNFEEGNGSFS